MTKLVRRDNHDIEIIGTADLVPATAQIQATEEGGWEYSGGSDMDWDAQFTKTCLYTGDRMFVDEDGEFVRQRDVVFLDEDGVAHDLK